MAENKAEDTPLAPAEGEEAAPAENSTFDKLFGMGLNALVKGVETAKQLDEKYKIVDKATVAATTTVAKAQELNETYKISEKAQAGVDRAMVHVKAVDEKLGISEKATVAMDATGAKLKELDEKHSVSATVSAKASEIDEKYGISNKAKELDTKIGISPTINKINENVSSMLAKPANFTAYMGDVEVDVQVVTSTRKMTVKNAETGVPEVVELTAATQCAKPEPDSLIVKVSSFEFTFLSPDDCARFIQAINQEVASSPAVEEQVEGKAEASTA